jgi:hypothetical protein
VSGPGIAVAVGDEERPRLGHDGHGGRLAVVEVVAAGLKLQTKYIVSKKPAWNGVSDPHRKAYIGTLIKH